MIVAIQSQTLQKSLAGFQGDTYLWEILSNGNLLFQFTNIDI